MGNCMSAEDPNRYQEIPRAKLTSLYNLPMPPENGYSNFVRLFWAKDTKQEAKETAQREKEGKPAATDVREGKYYLCLGFFYEPYARNEPPVNLGKMKKGKPMEGTWKALPKWSDPEYMEDILRNGAFFHNDEFILKHYKQAIREPEGYAYPEQYIKAYQHWNNGAKPSGDRIREHKVNVITTIMEELQRQEDLGNKDEDTIQKLKDIIESMDPDEDDVREDCEKRLKEKKQKQEEAADAKKDEEAKNA